LPPEGASPSIETSRRESMKTYNVELQRTSYITVTVEAENKDDAIALAWQELERDHVNIEDASWDIESIEEVEQ
jgi:hypothetical protein